jgi:hypothetical protein
MSVDNPKLLRERAAQCRHFARSAQLPDVAEMLARLADSFVERALRAEHGAVHGLDIGAYPVTQPEGDGSICESKV